MNVDKEICVADWQIERVEDKNFQISSSST
jgi:hypothetical protein